MTLRATATLTSSRLHAQALDASMRRAHVWGATAELGLRSGPTGACHSKCRQQPGAAPSSARGRAPARHACQRPYGAGMLVSSAVQRALTDQLPPSQAPGAPESSSPTTSKSASANMSARQDSEPEKTPVTVRRRPGGSAHAASCCSCALCGRPALAAPPARANSDDRAPCTAKIVTGFLGSGKTTFINTIHTSSEHGLKIAVIENEFGEVSPSSAWASADRNVSRAARGGGGRLESTTLCCQCRPGRTWSR